MKTKNGVPTTGSLVKNFFGRLYDFFLETGNMIVAAKKYQETHNEQDLKNALASAALAIEHFVYHKFFLISHGGTENTENIKNINNIKYLILLSVFSVSL